MRTCLAIVALLALTGPAAASEVEQFLKTCALQQDRAECENDARQFTKWYMAALKKDHISQRNVADTFSHGRSAAVARDPVQGCAWWLVVNISGSPKVDSRDWVSLETECSRLSLDELTNAKARAVAITKTIAAGGEQTSPTVKGKRPAKPLDGEAGSLF